MAHARLLCLVQLFGETIPETMFQFDASDEIQHFLREGIRKLLCVFKDVLR